MINVDAIFAETLENQRCKRGFVGLEGEDLASAEAIKQTIKAMGLKIVPTSSRLMAAAQTYVDQMNSKTAIEFCRRKGVSVLAYPDTGIEIWHPLTVNVVAATVAEIAREW